MYLTGRSISLMALGVIAAFINPHPRTMVLWSAAAGLVILLDALLAPSPRSLRLERHVARAVRLGESTQSRLTLTSTVSRPMRLAVRDAWQPSAGASPTRATLTLPAGQRRRLLTTLTPSRRGDRMADAVTIRSRGPLGLAGRQVSRMVPAAVRVLPAFSSRRHLASRIARLREIDGRSVVMMRGAGTEFDSLREYVVGDDVRAIDWQSTARRGEVVVRTWRPERDRRVLLIIDTGRLAAARLGDYPRLDAHIEATLLMAALASHAGDRVDVVAMDERIHTRIHGESGPALMSLLADRLAPLEASLRETDWQAMAGLVRSLLPQRALVIVLTALEGAGVDALRLRSLASLAREHTVVVASASDPELPQMAHSRATEEEAYLAAAAESDILELDTAHRALARAGVEVLEADAESLAPALADTYLRLKASGRL